MVAEGEEADKAAELPPAKKQKVDDAEASPSKAASPPPFGDDYVPADGGWFAHKGGQWLYNKEEKTFFHLPTGALHMETDAGLISLSGAGDDAEAEEADAEPPQRMKGEVRWFNATKGFGFIAPESASEDAKDIFVHRNQIVGAEGDPFAVLESGAKVTFALGETDRGKPCAVQVQVEDAIDEGADDGGEAADGQANDEEAMDDGEGSCASGSSVEIDLEAELNSGTYTVKGTHKDHCEDFAVHKVKIPISALGETATCIFYGVFDGHGGFTCAEYAAAHLAKNVLSRLRERAKQVSDEIALKTALMGGFKQTEHNFLGKAKRTNDGSGSTACTMTIFGPDENMRLRLFLANIGDSRAVLGRTDGKALRLTEDHKPDLPAEKKRIEAQGGAVSDVAGIWRCMLPAKKRLSTGIVGLAVSRAFGDKEFKSPDIVSAEPDVTVHEVDWDSDAFVILGSDGIWDVVTDKMAVRCVQESLRAGKNQDQAAEELVRRAVARGSKDDCTVVVVHFGWAKGAKAAAAADGLDAAEKEEEGDEEEADLEGGLSIAPSEIDHAAVGDPASGSAAVSADLELFDEDLLATTEAQGASAAAPEEPGGDDDDDDDDDDEYNLAPTMGFHDVGNTLPMASAGGPASAASTTKAGEKAAEASAKGLFDDLVPTREELEPVLEGPSLPGRGAAGEDAQKPAAPAVDDGLDMFG